MGGGGIPGRAGVRDTARDPGGHHPVAARPVEPGRATPGARHRAQTGRGGPAPAVRGPPGRRDLRRPADRAAGRQAVLRQRPTRRRPDTRAGGRAEAPGSRARPQPGLRHRVLGAADDDRGRPALCGGGHRGLARRPEPERPAIRPVLRPGRPSRR